MQNGFMTNEEAEFFSPKRAARKIFSRTLLPFVFFFAACYGAVFIIELAAAILFPLQAEEIFASPYFLIILNSVSMYCVGFPVFLIASRKLRCEVSPPEKQTISIKELIVIFLIGEGCMLLGSIIGNALNALISALTGNEIVNGIESLVSGTPLWLTVLIVVIVGPIIEEIMFRKIMIDRLLPLGEASAVIFSGIAFGLFHGNLYQLFYAALLGFVLGYVYVKTGRIIYPMVIHITVNFLGSAIPMLLTDIMTEYEKMLSAIELGGAVNEALFAKYSIIIALYMIFQYGIYLLGIALAVYCIIKKRPTLKRGALNLSPSAVASASVLNPGTLLFLAISFLSIALNILPM